MNPKDFPVVDARKAVSDLMAPDPAIYWADFVFSVSLGWVAFFTALFSPYPTVLFFAAYVVAALALYRSAIFIHELAHLKKGTFVLFRAVWNIVCGIPLLVPSFTYDGVHNGHHKIDVYGTRKDGEYVAFAVQHPFGMISYVFLSFVLPFLFIGRFLVLTPLSYFIPAVRRFAWARASSLMIDMSYERPVSAIKSDENWRWQEFATFVYAATVSGLIAVGIVPVKALILWYAIAALIFFFNSLRTLAAHAYRNPGDEKMSLSEQYLDSVNVPGNRFFTTLWAPVGLRYHATHHLFLTMPYHYLGKAHRRLAVEVGEPYLETMRTSLWNALVRIWREAKAARG